MDRGVSTLPEGLPEFTLGWGVVKWCGYYLRHGNGIRAGQNFKFTRSQLLFILWFYSVDENGRWLYDHAVRRWPKGSGKSPFAAVIALAEFLGPVRLARFDPNADGGCIGRPQPMAHVQIAATSESQTANTMKQVRAMAPKGSKVAADYGLDPGITRYNGPGGAILEVITSSAAAQEGAEVTFAIGDETEHWTPSRGGTALMEVLERNLAKTGSRMMETCNAWQPGEDSVAETSFDTWELEQQGRTRGNFKTLYDARIPKMDDTDLIDEEALTAVLHHAYEDTLDVNGGWAPLETIKNTIWNGKTRNDVALRFYLNLPTATMDAWVSRYEWDVLEDRDKVVEPGTEIAMFFDGSKSRDATALIGCRISDGHVFALGIWQPTGDEVVDAVAVDKAVRSAFEAYNVLGFFGDVREWESFVKVSWPDEFGSELLIKAQPTGNDVQRIAWDMRSHTADFTKACELVYEEVMAGDFTHDGNRVVSQHIANARRRQNRTGISIGKESKDSSKKIDAAVCVIGARMVRRLVMKSPEYERRSRRSGMVVFK